MPITLLYDSLEEKKDLMKTWELLQEKMNGMDELLGKINICSGYEDSHLQCLEFLLQEAEQKEIQFEKEIVENTFVVSTLNQAEEETIKEEWKEIQKESMYLHKILQEFRMRHSFEIRLEDEEEIKTLEEILETVNDSKMIIQNL